MCQKLLWSRGHVTKKCSVPDFSKTNTNKTQYVGIVDGLGGAVNSYGRAANDQFSVTQNLNYVRRGAVDFGKGSGSNVLLKRASNRRDASAEKLRRGGTVSNNPLYLYQPSTAGNDAAHSVTFNPHYSVSGHGSNMVTSYKTAKDAW
ncbi:uncharacterized protein Z518_00047 [Rhinocladiella mackenziei CBS 650.93]|uniref:Uncharacterized protein n=1 Tax=Rhinocladiella mackenziei CBS 650.93 TaxID=1442369 RepID=A0A0D2ISM1_9EURO|nr:uncharacterized protein Z518_00047 [Rhinocladiella mackenziei CBS 650.93]KIX08969.1 hypothetical protein Z518_00047 [Rhinocladiella mackenziei CBS 650.93]